LGQREHIKRRHYQQVYEKIKNPMGLNIKYIYRKLLFSKWSIPALSNA
jgi:hypothetical protein